MRVVRPASVPNSNSSQIRTESESEPDSGFSFGKLRPIWKSSEALTSEPRVRGGTVDGVLLMAGVHLKIG